MQKVNNELSSIIQLILDGHIFQSLSPDNAYTSNNKH